MRAQTEERTRSIQKCHFRKLADLVKTNGLVSSNLRIISVWRGKTPSTIEETRILSSVDHHGAKVSFVGAVHTLGVSR